MSIKSLNHELKLEEAQATHHDLIDIKKDISELYSNYQEVNKMADELGIKNFEDEIKGIMKKLNFE